MALASQVIRPVVVLALIVLAACTGHESRPVPTPLQGFAPWSDGVVAYRVGVGDKLQIRYLRTPEMNDDVTVAPDGSITSRAAGRMVVADETVIEVTDQVRVRAQRWLRDPDVTVIPVDTPSSRIYVGGAVNRPGPFPMGGRIGVFEAVVLAGGFTPEARVPEIVLIRRGKDDRPMLRTVDIKAFLDTGSTANDVPLAAGDIIFVPRSKIAEVDLWVDQFINRVIPFQRAFSYTININQGPWQP